MKLAEPISTWYGRAERAVRAADRNLGMKGAKTTHCRHMCIFPSPYLLLILTSGWSVPTGKCAEAAHKKQQQGIKQFGSVGRVSINRSRQPGWQEGEFFFNMREVFLTPPFFF